MGNTHALGGQALDADIQLAASGAPVLLVNQDTQLVLARWTGAAWATTTVPSTSGRFTRKAQLLVDSRDAAFVAFTQHAKGGPRAVAVSMHLPPSLGGGQHFLGATTGFAATVEQLRMALGPDGSPVVVYEATPGGELMVAAWRGSLGSPPSGAWVPAGGAVAPGPYLPSRPGIAVGGDGTIYVGYSDATADGRLTVKQLAPGGATWQAVGGPGASTWPAAAPMLAVLPSGGLVAAFFNRPADVTYINPWAANPGATALLYDGAAWGPLGRPFFGGPQYPAGKAQGVYSKSLGLALGGGNLYTSFRDGNPYEGLQAEMVMALNQATGEWSALGGTHAGSGCGSTYTPAYNAVAAGARSVCAVFWGWDPSLPEDYATGSCGVSVACFSA